MSCITKAEAIKDNAVAVIGAACRFPDSNDIEEFWNSLQAGRDNVSDRPPGVMNSAKSYSTRGYLADIDAFDAEFFQISRRDAEFLNPEHRVFLECAWHAMEDAGYDPLAYDGVAAVYATAGANDYQRLVEQQVRSSAEELLAYISNGPDFLPSLVSYKLNLKGESIAVQTACSSSLVAVHLACRSLIDGESSLALAGGANIAIPSIDRTEYQEGMIFTPDGRCRAFDHRANGMVAADGVGVVVLKRFDRALRDRDHIYGVILGSALNNDGDEKISYPAPSIGGQAEVIATALEVAGLSASTISYLEAHGTGTVLGDPIEIAALTRAFRLTTDDRRYCALGTVKSNIGHAIHAAGIAGLLKVLLALRAQEIPPSLHFEKPNPEIDFDNSPFFVNAVSRPWKSNGSPRRAGVSSFGVGGTNAHVIVEEPPVISVTQSLRSAHLLTLSARTAAALERGCLNLAAHLQEHAELSMPDVAFTLQTGRHEFPMRRAIACSDRLDAIGKLRSKVETSVVASRSKQLVAFVFPGIGSQHPSMGRELYETLPAFRCDVDRGFDCFLQLTGKDLRGALYGSEADAKEALIDARLAHAAIFILEYALARVWQRWGINPAAVIGHSVGEYAAACIAGVFSFEDALGLVASRAQLIANLPGGAMLALPLSAEALQPLMPQNAWIAIVNAPSFCVVAGEVKAIESLEAAAAAKRIFASRLLTSHAVHTTMMQPMEAVFAKQFAGVATADPQIRILSGSTGDWLSATEIRDASYWTAHASQPVNFSRALDRLFEQSDIALLEVGPSNVLGGLARLHPTRGSQPIVSSLPSGRDKQSDWQALTSAVAELWRANAPVDWTSFNADEQRLRVSLPGYAFERSRYWIRREGSRAGNFSGDSKASKKISLPAEWLYRAAWKRTRLPPPYHPGDLGRRTGVCLLFAAEDRYASPERELRHSGQDVVVVLPGAEYCRLSSRRFIVDPRQRSHYQLLLQKVEQDLGEIRSVLLFADRPDRERCRDDELTDAYCNLLLVTQSLADRARQVDLWIITQQGCVVPNVDTVIHAEHALLFGLSRVIPQEVPALTVRCIDFAATEYEWGSLLAELADPSEEQEIAYRGADRWVCRYAPLQIREDAMHDLFHEPGVWVILGGLGHVGLCLADALAAIPGVKLALISRREFATVKEWANRQHDLTLAEDARERIGRLAALRKHGLSLELYSTDIADPVRAGEVIRKIRKRQGKILGIIHAAGVVDTAHLKFISETTLELSRELLRPHVSGCAVLAEIVKKEQPRYCVLCSSLSTVVGGLSYGAHAAGHRYMDTVAQREAARNAEGTKWITIDYDTWLVNSRSLGLGSGDSHLHILPHEGSEVLRLALSAGESRVLVSTIPLDLRLTQLQHVFTRAEGQRSQSLQTSDRVAASSPKSIAVDQIQNVVLALFQQVLGDCRIALHDNFFAFGGTSLSMLDLINRVNRELGVRIPLVKGFRAPSPATMAELAHGELVGAGYKELV